MNYLKTYLIRYTNEHKQRNLTEIKAHDKKQAKEILRKRLV